MTDQGLSLLGSLLAGERCPTCGSEPYDDTVHRDGCPRVDTCGQYGPPWLDAPWHPEDPPLPRRAEGETMDGFNARARVWRDALGRHRVEVHHEMRSP